MLSLRSSRRRPGRSPPVAVDLKPLADGDEREARRARPPAAAATRRAPRPQGLLQDGPGVAPQGEFVVAEGKATSTRSAARRRWSTPRRSRISVNNRIRAASTRARRRSSCSPPIARYARRRSPRSRRSPQSVDRPRCSSAAMRGDRCGPEGAPRPRAGRGRAGERRSLAQLDAIRSLAESRSSSTRLLLLPFVEKNPDGSFGDPTRSFAPPPQSRDRRHRRARAHQCARGFGLHRREPGQRAAARRTGPRDHLRADGRHQHGARRAPDDRRVHDLVVQSLFRPTCPAPSTGTSPPRIAGRVRLRARWSA